MDMSENTSLLKSGSESFRASQKKERPRIGSIGAASALNPYIYTSTKQEKVDPSKQSDVEKDNFKFSSITRKQKCVLITCLFTNFLQGCAFSQLAPFYPQEAARKGMSTLVVGIVFSIFELVIFVTSPFVGFYLTKLGLKFVLLTGAFIGGSCTVLFGLLDMCPPGTPFIVMSILCRSIGALGLSGLVNSMAAVLAFQFPKNVASCFSLLESSFGVGMMVGPAIGGGLYELGGFGLPFYVTGSLLLIEGSMFYFVVPNTENAQQENDNGSRLSILRSPMVLIAMTSCATSCLSIAFIDPTLANHLVPFGLSVGVVGLIFVILPAMTAILSPLFGFILDRKNVNQYFLTGGSLIFGLGFLFLGPTDLLPFLPYKLWVIIIGLVLLGCGFGCFFAPVVKSMIQGAVEMGFEENLELYSFVAGLYNSMFALGGFLGALLGGILVGQVGFPWASTIIAMVNFFMGILAFTYFCSKCISRRK